jgi:hypothetical protein
VSRAAGHGKRSKWSEQHTCAGQVHSSKYLAGLAACHTAAAIHGREVSREPGKRGVQLQPWQPVHVAGINPCRASPPPPLIGKQLPCTPVPEDEEEGSAETGSAKDTAGLTACVF